MVRTGAFALKLGGAEVSQQADVTLKFEHGQHAPHSTAQPHAPFYTVTNAGGMDSISQYFTNHLILSFYVFRAQRIYRKLSSDRLACHKL